MKYMESDTPRLFITGISRGPGGGGLAGDLNKEEKGRFEYERRRKRRVMCEPRGCIVRILMNTNNIMKTEDASDKGNKEDLGLNNEEEKNQ